MKRTFTSAGVPRLIAEADKTSSRALTLDYTKLPVALLPYGIVLAIVTATGKGRCYGKTLVKTTGSAKTVIELKAVDGRTDFVVPYVKGDTIDVGANSGCTVSDVDQGAKTVTVTAAINVVADTTVTTKDGSETATGILYGEVNNTVGDNWTDEDRQVAVIDYGVLYGNACMNLDSAAKTALGRILFR